MNIYLRALELEDYLLTTQWRNDPEVTSLLGGNKNFVSSYREKKWVENVIMNDTVNIRLGIVLKKENKLIGLVNLTNIDNVNRKAEFSIMIGDKEQWGKKFGEAASLLMLDFGFLEKDLERIYLTVDKRNMKAISLYEKIGFKQEGLLRSYIYKNGEYRDVFLYSILKQEYAAGFGN